MITTEPRRRPWPVALTGLMATTLLAGCGISPQTTAGFDSEPAGPDGSSPRLRVATGLYPLEFAAERVGGDRVQVVNLTPAGAEPHDLELAPTDVLTLDQADLAIALPGFQPAVDDALADLGEQGPHVLDVTATARLLDHGHAHADHADHDHHDHHADHDHSHGDHDDHGHEHDDGHDHGMDGADPHFWLDPLRLADVADEIAAELGALDPAGTEEYTAGARGLRAELESLDAEYRQGLAACQRSTIVTSHEAFGYLSDRYGLTEESVAGLDPEGEPAPVRVHEIATIIAETGVTTVFTEPLTPPKVAHVLGEELSIEVGLLDPIESRPDGGYPAAARRNLSALRTALGCS